MPGVEQEVVASYACTRPMTKLEPAKISGDGLVYPVDADGTRLEVLVSLDADGQGWRVRFDVGGSQYGGHGTDPLAAFQVAADLARVQLVARRGVALDVESIERELLAREALTADVKIRLTASAQAAIGLVTAYPAEVDPVVVEHHLRDASFMQRTQGISSQHWRVEAAPWKDFGRELLVCVHLGA